MLVTQRQTRRGGMMNRTWQRRGLGCPCAGQKPLGQIYTAFGTEEYSTIDPGTLPGSYGTAIETGAGTPASAPQGATSLSLPSSLSSYLPWLVLGVGGIAFISVLRRR